MAGALGDAAITLEGEDAGFGADACSDGGAAGWQPASTMSRGRQCRKNYCQNVHIGSNGLKLVIAIGAIDDILPVINGFNASKTCIWVGNKPHFVARGNQWQVGARMTAPNTM